MRDYRVKRACRHNSSKYAVYKAARVVAAELFCQLDGLIDHRLDRGFFGVVDQNLIQRNAQNRFVDPRHLVHRPARRGFLDDTIKIGVMFPHTKDKLPKKALGIGGQHFVFYPARHHFVGRVIGRIEFE